MKLLKKIKKWFRRKPKQQEKSEKSKQPEQQGIYFSTEELKQMWSEKLTGSRSDRFVDGPECEVVPAGDGKIERDSPDPLVKLGPSYNVLLNHPPTLKRVLRRVFMEREETALRYYSDGELDPLLVERGGTRYYPSSWEQQNRQATPTVLITKRPGYKRKIDGKYGKSPTSITIDSGVVVNT